MPPAGNQNSFFQAMLRFFDAFLFIYNTISEYTVNPIYLVPRVPVLLKFRART